MAHPVLTKNPAAQCNATQSDLTVQQAWCWRPLSGLRILVVEDELLILMMIEDMLSDLGCSAVVSAASVDKALALIAGQRFDIAMLDMNLGGGDSNAVAQALARHGVPFVYCTGNRAGNDTKGEFARAVLRKPFSAEELAAALHVAR